MSHTPDHKEITTFGQTEEQRRASFEAVGLGVPVVSDAITSASIEPSITPVLEQQEPLPIPETQTLVSKEFTTPSGAIVTEEGETIAPPPTDFTTQLDELLGDVEGRDRAGEIAVRTQEQQRQVLEINKQIQLQQAQALEAQNIARERGETLGFAGLEQQRVARASAVEAIRLSATAQAIQGNLALANQLAGRAVDEEFRQQERDIQTARNNIIANFENFSAEEKKRAEATLTRLDADDAFVKEQKANRKAIEGQINTAANLGATLLQLEDIRNSANEAEAIQKRVSAGLVDPRAGLEERRVSLAERREERLGEERDDVFTTPEGEDIDFKTIAGITILKDKGFSRAEINSFMDTETKLDKSSRDGLLNEVFGEEKATLDDSQIPLIIETINQLIKKGDVTRKQIRLMLDTNSFTSKGKIISLTEEQSQEIRAGIRTFFERIIPGGD